MPKNKGKGGKRWKKISISSNTPNISNMKHELILKDESEIYAKVVKMVGNSNVQVADKDKNFLLAHIRGSMRKRVWINPGDLVLVSLRDFQENKGDIIHLYNTEEVHYLKQLDEWKEPDYDGNDSSLVEFADE